MTGSTQHSLKLRHSFYLLLAAFLWGTTFVAQSIATDLIGPFTYNAARFFLGSAVLLPLAIVTGRIDPLAANYRGSEIPGISRNRASRIRDLAIGGIACGLCLFLAGGFQQIGIIYTTAGKSGFVTALYIILVPVIGLFFHRKSSPMIWAAILIAVAGFYLLCVTEDLSINRGDVITLGSSFMFACHILTIDHFSPRVNGIQLSCVQFFTAGMLSLIPAFLLETPSFAVILNSWMPICYAGILSSGVAYTLQIIGQRGIHPTVASLLMSLESVISVLSGWLILGDAMSLREIAGCALVFAGVILAQLPSRSCAKNTEAI